MTSSLPLSTTTPRETLSQKLPPLENGDRLTRHEFDRRYRTMPEIKKAELIEGVVYMASPLRFTTHAQPHGLLITNWNQFRRTSNLRSTINPTTAKTIKLLIVN